METTEVRTVRTNGPTATLRPVQTREEFRACVELQRATWGEDFEGCVPAMILELGQKVGGIVAGAFGEDGELLGFVYGFPAVEDGISYHWSHMLAVREEVRGYGLGRKLKIYQRRLLLERDVPAACWTFDPMVSRNAHLNLNRLGAEVVAYVPDMYPDDAGCELQVEHSDRLVAFWELEGSRAVRAIAGLPDRQAESHADAPVVLDDPREAAAAEDAETSFPMEPAVRIRVPEDVQALRAEDPDLARRWSEQVREAFLTYLPEGYRVQGFVGVDDGAPAYLLLGEEIPPERPAEEDEEEAEVAVEAEPVPEAAAEPGAGADAPPAAPAREEEPAPDLEEEPAPAEARGEEDEAGTPGRGVPEGPEEEEAFGAGSDADAEPEEPDEEASAPGSKAEEGDGGLQDRTLSPFGRGGRSTDREADGDRDGG